MQWFAAATQPPHLACIVPFDGGADMYRDVAYHGGIMALGFPAGWHMAEIRANYRVGDTDPPSTLGQWDLPWNVINHPTVRRFLEDPQPRLQQDPVPVYSIGILHKVGIHLRGNIRGYEEVTTPKKLLLCHGDFEGDEMAIFNSDEMRNSCCCAGTTTGSRATIPGSWTRTRSTSSCAAGSVYRPRTMAAAADPVHASST